MTFTEGEIVTHKLTGEKLLVLRHGKEQYQCRTPDYREVYFWEMELAKI